MANASEYRGMNEEEIARQIAELRQARFDKKLQHRIGELQNSGELTANRKDLARLLTVLREKQIQARAAKK